MPARSQPHDVRSESTVHRDGAKLHQVLVAPEESVVALLQETNHSCVEAFQYVVTKQFKPLGFEGATEGLNAT